MDDSSGILRLFVLTHKTIAFSACATDTVEQLKRIVGSVIGVDFNEIQLTYGTKFLLNKYSLGKYLPDQATLHLSLPLLGGNGVKAKRQKVDQKAASFETKDLSDTNFDCDLDTPLFSESVNERSSVLFSRPDLISKSEEDIDESLLCESNELPNFNHFIHFWPFTFSLQYRDKCQQRQQQQRRV